MDRKGARRNSPGEVGATAPSHLEEELRARGLHHLAGIDEAGRGPLAGPVIAVALILPSGIRIPDADDSKRLSAKTRERIALEIEREALALGIGGASSREVDEINILQATHLAMKRAVGRLGVRPDHLIVDGLPVPILGEEQTAVVKADRTIHTVACASIIAKVTRDRIMRRLAERYPGYGWESNAGYGTPGHLAALERLGPTPHHRRSFRPVQLSLAL